MITISDYITILQIFIYFIASLAIMKVRQSEFCQFCNKSLSEKFQKLTRLKYKAVLFVDWVTRYVDRQTGNMIKYFKNLSNVNVVSAAVNNNALSGVGCAN